MSCSHRVIVVPALGIVLAGCGLAGDGSSRSSHAVNSLQNSREPARPAPRAPEPVGDGLYRMWASSARIQRTTPYRFTLYTHCGLDRSLPDFDGSLWDFSGPASAPEEQGNPPKGFGNPEDEGTMTLVVADRAEFVSSGGVVVRFQRGKTSKIVRPCY